MSRKALVVGAAALAVLLICMVAGMAAGSEQVRFIVRRQGEDVSSKCMAIVSNEDGGLGGFYSGGPNGLWGELPPGKYSAIVQVNAQQGESPSMPGMVEFEVVAGRQNVVEVELMILDLGGLTGLAGLADLGGFGDGGADDLDLGYGGEDDFGWSYGQDDQGWGYSQDGEGWGYSQDGLPRWGGAGDSSSSSGGAGPGSQGRAGQRPPVDPWMADVDNRPFMGPWGPLDE